MSLLSLLLACTSPPSLQAESQWVAGPCGHLDIAVQIQSEPGVPLVVNRAGQSPLSGQADAAGGWRVQFPAEEFGSLSVLAGSEGEQTVLQVPSPGPILRNESRISTASGKPYVKTTCARPGEQQVACKMSVQPGGVDLGGGVPRGSVLEVEGARLELAEGVVGSALPIGMAGLADWDLGVFSDGSHCPYLPVPGVAVTVKGTRYEGEVWTTRVGADYAIGQALGGTLNGSPWPVPATGQVALIVQRGNDHPEASHSFLRWEGEPQTLSDVRWIGRQTASRVQLGSCGTYVEEGTGAQREVLDSRRDLHVELVERASGVVLAETTLKGKNAGCGPIAFGASQGSALPEAAAQAWFEAQLASRIAP